MVGELLFLSTNQTLVQNFISFSLPEIAIFIGLTTCLATHTYYVAMFPLLFISHSLTSLLESTTHKAA